MASFYYFLLAFLFSSTVSDATGWFGVNYGQIADNLPTPDKVVQLLKTNGITKAKIYDTNAAVLTAFAKTNISLVVCLPNEQLQSAANDQTFADNWVQANITKYYPATQIDAIAIGNEVFADPANRTPFLIPAMQNIYNSLQKLKLDSSIKVSSPIAFSALQNSYPSSAGAFKSDLAQSVMVPMLKLLKQSNSYLMANAYPFFAYEANSNQISLDYTLFRNNPGTVDSGNGLKYFSLLEAQVDAIYAAMNAIGYPDVPIVVSESGWPSVGDTNEIGAGMANAATYNGNLVNRVLTGGGTPLRPQFPLNVYLFALFNEDQKPGPTSERNYGLFYPNMQKVYNIPFTAAAPASGAPAPVGASNKRNKHEHKKWIGGSKVSVGGQTWCLANFKAEEKVLKEALDYACGEGKADCDPIQPGKPCYEPNTLEAHASYAFNSFYQKNKRAAGTCNFNGAAYVAMQAPQFGNCEFPTGYGN